MNYVLIGTGLWLILDGAASIIKYRKEPIFQEHFIRVVRIGCGIVVIIQGLGN